MTHTCARLPALNWHVCYLQAFLHWTGILTSRLVGKVKLVGSTISCEGTFKNGDLSAERRENPHVQSYVMATDQVQILGHKHVIPVSIQPSDLTHFHISASPSLNSAWYKDL